MIQISSKQLLIISATLSAIPISSYLFQYFYKKKIKKIHDEINRKDALNYYHCIFLSVKNLKCRQHVFESDPCDENCSYHVLNRILSLINSARHTVSICMYMLSLRELGDAVLEAHNRGVVVRVITDIVTIKMKQSRWAQLKHIYNIPIKSPDDEVDSLMHHKFCLIDENTESEAKLLTGSLNMTLQGLCANYEFLLFTNNSQMIRAFSNEFEKLWDELPLLCE